MFMVSESESENTGSEPSNPFAVKAKHVFYTALLVGSFFLGEYVSPVEKISNEIKYHNISAENGFPQDFRQLDKVVRINERNRAEVYFGNVEDSVLHPVKKNYHTRRDPGKRVDTYLSNTFSKLDSLVKTYTSNWFDSVKKSRSDSTRTDSSSELKGAWNDIKKYVNEKLE